MPSNQITLPQIPPRPLVWGSLFTNNAQVYYKSHSLTTGSGGSGGAFRAMEKYAPIGMLVGSGAAGYADYKGTKARQQEESEAADEIKRETRGVQKTSTDRARDDAREMKAMEQADRASRAASRDMGMKKGGYVHHSEHYGKHAGGHKLHMDHVKAMCGGGYAKAKK